jgi:hypothetical protein
MDIAGGVSIFEKLFKGGKYLLGQYRKNPSYYLDGELTSGLDVAYRIIALFEAHDVKRTQIYRLLGDRFPEIKPSLDAEHLQTLLNGELFDSVCEIFGVRKAWVEGEAGRIYDPLYHYKDLSAFGRFAHELKERNPEKLCLLTALKPSGTSESLYVDSPNVALFFSEQIVELDGKIIYRHHPIYDEFPWDHVPARYHLCAFFNIVYEAPLFPIKGYNVAQKHVDKVSAGEAIPMHKTKVTGIWHPGDYAYPIGQFNGNVKLDDWQGLLKYFDAREERTLLKGSSAEETTGLEGGEGKGQPSTSDKMEIYPF